MGFLNNIYDDILSPLGFIKIISSGTLLIALKLVMEERKKSIAREGDIKELIELLISIYSEEMVSKEGKAKINDIVEKINKRGKK